METDPPSGGGPWRGAGASHAWCSLWVPQQGWIDLDPTNDHLPTNRHVTLAWGRDYGDVAPVRGVVIGPAVEQSLAVEVAVERMSPDRTV
jgi:transglutaminase-like putative cysteine protease